MAFDHFSKEVLICLRVAAMAAALVAAGIAAAAGREGGSIVHTRAAGALSPGGAADAMIERARAKGLMRVIVGLSLTMRHGKSLAEGAAQAQRQALAAAQDRVAERTLGAGASAAVRFEAIPYMSAFVDADALGRLLRDPDVVSVQEDVAVEPYLKQSIPLIHADALFAKDVDGTKHVVAVLDTGVAVDHPMLVDKVVSEACYSTTDDGQDAHSVCPGGLPTATGSGTGKFCALGVAGCDHGTHVASIAAGNSNRLDGVARGADVIAIQIFSKFDSCGTSGNPCVKSFETDQIRGLERVLKLSEKFNIDAANMSLGGGSNSGACDADRPAMKAAIDNLRAEGVATVIASGNDGFTNAIGAPACISTAIAVGNTTDDDLVNQSSNHSPFVRLLAPGTDIEAAVPRTRYGEKTGTSMSTPHVAGAFALLRDAKPTATIDAITAALVCSGKTVHVREMGTAAPVELEPQRPRIDVLGAFNYLRAPPSNKRDWLFDDADDEKDWSPLLGLWSSSGGVYAPVMTPGWLGSYVANCSSAYRAEAVMRRTDPATAAANFYANAGLMFNHATKTVSGYWVAYNKCRTTVDGACTGADADKPGQAVFWKMTNVDLDGTAGFAENKCRVQAKVNVNKANVVRVVSNGSSHSFFLNDRLVCQVTDASYVGGPIMATTFVRETAGHSFVLNELRTQSTDPGPATDADAVIDAAAYAAEPPAGMSLFGSSAVAAR